MAEPPPPSRAPAEGRRGAEDWRGVDIGPVGMLVLVLAIALVGALLGPRLDGEDPVHAAEPDAPLDDEPPAVVQAPPELAVPPVGAGD